MLNAERLQHLMGVALEYAGADEKAADRYRHALELVPDMQVAAKALKRLEVGQ